MCTASSWFVIAGLFFTAGQTFRVRRCGSESKSARLAICYSVPWLAVRMDCTYGPRSKKHGRKVKNMQIWCRCKFCAISYLRNPAEAGEMKRSNILYLLRANTR